MKTLLCSFVLSTLSLSALGALSACTVDALPSGEAASDVDAGNLGPGVQPTMPFAPSNMSALASHDLSHVDDTVISKDCDLDADQQSVDCFGSFVTTWVDAQSDGSQARVFAFKSLTIAQTAHVHVYGSMPVVLLAIGDMTIAGQVAANALGETAGPGGFASTIQLTKGSGPGGGTAGVVGDPNNGIGGVSGGGGSFCGLGGQGTKEADPSGKAPAPLASPVAYGVPKLVPLIAGSSGGEGGLAKAGAGGGAVELVAGGAFKVASLGSVNVGGGAGAEPGVTGLQEASGAGSGGAILVEAMTAEIDGALAANGGSGAGYDSDGQNGSPDGNPAVGGKSAGAPQGGNGSAGATLDGAAGVVASNGSAGSGGGGAGRIRINTQSGAAKVAGTISPALTTACGTQGTLVLTGADAGH